MSLINLKRGEILVSKNEATGYFMVMGFKSIDLIVSPLFWCDKIIYKTIDSFTAKYQYKRHDGRIPSPIVQARYDHEKMRRINKL